MIDQFPNHKLLFPGIFMLLLSPFLVLAQGNQKDSLLSEVTLQTAISYAMVRQPVIQQSLVDQQILETTIRSKLADWYPQINMNYSVQHNFLVQTAVIGGNTVKLGAENISPVQLTLSQTIFNRDVFLARKSQTDVRLQAQQLTNSDKIDLAANVSKAFYDILATTQQINVSVANILRIERSLKDAFNQYQAGVADKIDYKRATITLNNSKATKRSNEELLKAKVEYLKSLMGYPETAPLNIVFDSLQMEREIVLDTLQQPQYNSRIEYQLLETRKRLLEYNLKYNKWSYLPTVSANAAYNLNYQSNNFNKLYSNNYPSSFAALTFSVPIFQGGKRRANIRGAELELVRNDLEILNLRNNISAAYSQALASYKSNYANYSALKENLQLAREVYDVVQLQYRSGIKTYLEVITSETDLRTTEINYIAAMYQLLTSKIDVQRELGQINY